MSRQHRDIERLLGQTLPRERMPEGLAAQTMDFIRQARQRQAEEQADEQSAEPSAAADNVIPFERARADRPQTQVTQAQTSQAQAMQVHAGVTPTPAPPSPSQGRPAPRRLPGCGLAHRGNARGGQRDRAGGGRRHLVDRARPQPAGCRGARGRVRPRPRLPGRESGASWERAAPRRSRSSRPTPTCSRPWPTRGCSSST